MKLHFNRDQLRDRIYACWMGKNMGGTMGAPYERTQDLLDIQGFITKPGEVLPNDDLDLQLVWLRAVGDLGPKAINEKVLGEYWLSYIEPDWNEYGICKSNLREGLVPPLSGELNNNWKHSNGAWIRTEIWVCLFPGDPETTIRYAYYDACVDHGYGEGTYATVFIAAMESAAFVIHDISALLELGLSKIPADCRVARSVRLVMDAYQRGDDWKSVRQCLVEDSEDLGWFQAPANIAFVVLGLLYGEGDFKRSMILAINCGDDTDCTGATIGSLMGILRGTEGLPSDWMQYIGDDIKSKCLLNGHGNYPTTCSELTDAVMELLPVTLGKARFTWWDTRIETNVGDTEDFFEIDPAKYKGTDFIDELNTRSKWSFTAEGLFCDVLIEYDTEPRIAPNGTLTGKVSVRSMHLPEQKHYSLRWWTENGWHVESKLNIHDNRNVHVDAVFPYKDAVVPFTIHAGDTVHAMNRIVLEVSSVGRSIPVYITLNVMG